MATGYKTGPYAVNNMRHISCEHTCKVCSIKSHYLEKTMLYDENVHKILNL